MPLSNSPPSNQRLTIALSLGCISSTISVKQEQAAELERMKACLNGYLLGCSLDRPDYVSIPGIPQGAKNRRAENCYCFESR
ncbi:hypothetical protein JTE90_006070 [Oedothorax gibbosus]|uniref:Uncharacterized protein n=1 Tax=Oedothorax gibbosus TaxID=931172 RepID=A0AAV6V3N2_9ARAC|nr:hypothetical protein JTE90_006070 [Oedothorax gibbosus]